MTSTGLSYPTTLLITFALLYCRPQLWGWKKTTGVRRHANKLSLSLIWGGMLAVVVAISIVFAKGNAGSDAVGTQWAWIDVVGRQSVS